MRSNMLRTAAATAAYGLVQGAQASRTAKRAARGLIGDRRYDGLYRASYHAQRFATLGALRPHAGGGCRRSALRSRLDVPTDRPRRRP